MPHLPPTSRRPAGNARSHDLRARRVYVTVMTWVTRRGIRVNRTATAWLVRRFIDPDVRLAFVEAHEVARLQDEEGATGFDAPGATYPHVDARGRCSFEALVDEHRADDAALVALARIVGGADLPDRLDVAPESAGLRAISAGFPLVARDDHEIVEKASFLYDALYASLRARLGRS